MENHEFPQNPFLLAGYRLALLNNLNTLALLKHLLSTSDSIILTITKSKLDISFNALAVFFISVTEVTIRITFYDIVKETCNNSAM